MSAAQQDRNFDSLVDKFSKQIYQTQKGNLRLSLLKEDLASLRQHTTPLTIWDAGCGFAQISQWLAKAGHQLTLCDLSKKMLHQAQTQFEQAQLNAQFYHGAAQELAPQLPNFEVILFHAVLEWLAKPKETLKIIVDKLQPKGYLSLLFYNRNALIYTNAIKGEWRIPFLLKDGYWGKTKNLTPPHPHYPYEVLEWLNEWGFDIKIQTGIRVFNDYLTPEINKKTDAQALLDLEYRYCRHPTFKDMGRYIHILAQKPAQK